MGFINFPTPTPIFPILSPLTWSVHKQPSLASDKYTAVSGRDTLLCRAVYPRWEFTLSYGGDSWLREQTQNSTPYTPLSGHTELEQLSGLFLQCLGAYGEFYYSDPDDNSRLTQQIGITDGVNSTFQIYYSIGAGGSLPDFTAPVSGIQTISSVYLNGSLQAGSSYGLDPTKTKLVFTSAPAAGQVITATFSFYYRCRFLADLTEYSQWALNLWEAKQVKFQSVKP